MCSSDLGLTLQPPGYPTLFIRRDAQQSVDYSRDWGQIPSPTLPTFQAAIRRREARWCQQWRTAYHALSVNRATEAIPELVRRHPSGSLLPFYYTDIHSQIPGEILLIYSGEEGPPSPLRNCRDMRGSLIDPDQPVAGGYEVRPHATDLAGPIFGSFVKYN